MPRQSPKTEAVDTMPGLAPWVGGKRNLAKLLAARIAAIPHDCYAEPFVGMGGVFFRRAAKPETEAINDRSGEVTNLFRVVKHHPSALVDELALLPTARSELERLWKIDPTTLTDVQRAARFYRVQRMNYGGLPSSRQFPCGRKRGRGLRPEVITRHIDRAWRRLSTVSIENRDFEAFIRLYDGPRTLFYLDPPYHGVESYYGKGLFARADFTRLADTLRSIQGRFLMSINDAKPIRELFAWARLEEVPVTYRVRYVQKTSELLIGDGRRR